MAAVVLNLLGGFRLDTGSGREVAFGTKKAKALLAYLALHPRQPQSRHKLAALLWEDSGEAQARESLRQTLSQLRRALSPDHVGLLAADGDAVVLKEDGISVDVREFERLVAIDAPHALQQASEFYRGELLDGFHLRAAPFEEWMMAERQRLRERALHGLNRLLSSCLGTGEMERGIAVGIRLLALDPLQEGVHRTLMELYCRQGRHASALRQYRICVETLARELGVEPDTATKAYHRQIIEERHRLRQPAERPSPTAQRPAPAPAAAPAPRGARRYASMLCAAFDIEAAVSLTDDPEETQELLAPALSAITDIARRHGGTVTAATGSALSVAFGVPAAQEDHAHRAVSAALDIASALRRMAGAADLPAMLHIGIDSGEIVLRGQAPAEAFGVPVKLAARLADHLRLGGICVSARTAALVQESFSLAPAGEASLADAGNAPLFRLLERSPTAGRARLRRHFLPFTGRKAYVEMLERALERAPAPGGESITLVGEAGVGKSRLITEFAGIARRAQWQVLETGGVPDGAQTALKPFIDLLKDYFGIADEDPVEAARGKLVRRVLAVDDGLRPAISPLLALLGLPPEDEVWDRLGAPQRTRQIHLAIRSLLLQETRRRPLALIVEDVHWLDGESLELLDALVDGAATAPMVLLLSCRPEFTDRWSQRPHARRLYVHPFQAATTATFLNIVLGDDPSLEMIKRGLAERCAGNPFFIEATVRMLVEQAVLKGQPGGYALSAATPEVGIPETVHAVLAARIDRLPPAQKQLLQLASVIGLHVPHSVLAAVSPWPEDELLQHFAGLQACGMIYESRLLPDAQYSFRHVLTCEVAYHGLLREDRRALHLHVAGAIESCFADRSGEFAASLAHHLERAGQWEKAAGYYRAAAERAKERYALRIAGELCGRALDCVERSGDATSEREAIFTLLGDIASLKDEQEQANQWYAKALALPLAPERLRWLSNKQHRLGTASRAGARLCYSETGHGKHTILLLNPLIYSPALFQPVIDEFCHDYRIVTIAPRGSGGSDAMPARYSWHDRAEDVRATIEALGSGPVTGIGVSRGSNLLIRLAAEHPALLARLVLLGTPVDDCGPESLFPRSPEVVRPIREALEADDLPRAVAEFCRSLFSEPDVDDLVELQIRSVMLLSKESFLAFFQPDPEADIRAYLPRIKIPTLVTHGTADRRVSPRSAPYIAERIAGARCYFFEDKGHVAIYSAAREFCGVLRDFLRETGG